MSLMVLNAQPTRKVTLGQKRSGQVRPDQSPGRLGRVGDMRDDSAEILVQSSLRGGHHEQFRYGQGRPLVDVDQNRSGQFMDRFGRQMGRCVGGGG